MPRAIQISDSEYREFKPTHPQLIPYIKLYYTHRSDNHSGKQRITYFPNYTTTLNIYQNSHIKWDKYCRTHSHIPSEKPLQLLVSKIDRSREIIMQGPFNKLSIVFHPLGINHFLDRPLSKIGMEHFSFFTAFGSKFEKLMVQLLVSEDLNFIRQILDHFFLQQLKPFDHHLLIKAVDRLLQDTQIPINELALDLGISRKTIYRKFKTHLMYGPTEYRSIIKFRQALDRFQKATKELNITQLAYAGQYYDQADLNNQFKLRTGLTPKQLFSTLQSLTNELHWKID